MGIKVQAHIVTALTKEELLDKLRQGDYSIGSGRYRLVLFNPDARRIEMAANIVGYDKPWKGRQDVWFTNEPTLTASARLVFMYPGYNPFETAETDSVADFFGLSKGATFDLDDELLRTSQELLLGYEIYSTALERLNIKPDIIIGHSLGEWFGMKASGLVTDESIRRLFMAADPSRYQITDAWFIAVGAGLERLSGIIANIPDLYVANDNCPNQVLLCGTAEARDALLAELKIGRIFYQVLPFQSGFHTPFLQKYTNILVDNFSELDVRPPHTPLWSANSLAPYPADADAVKELSVRHVLQTVRFRELLEKLYDEQQARMFIQVGTGSLIGFADDTFANRPYAAVPVATTQRTTIEQLRRVLALLFIEGKELDDTNLNYIREGFVHDHANIHADTTLNQPQGHIPEAAKEQPNIPAVGDEKAKNNPLTDATDNAVVAFFRQNLQELADIQTEIISKYGEQASVGAISNMNASSENIAVKPASVQENRQAFEEELNISLETHPYLIDHCLMSQPAHWPHVFDRRPVIPMTMTVELMAETAKRQAPTRKVCKLGPVSVFQWMPVHEPFVRTIAGTWKSPDTVSLNIKDYASCEVTMGDSYPLPPSEYEAEILLGDDIKPSPTREDIYENRLFHGPAYRGIHEIQLVTAQGVKAIVNNCGGKGSLLDALGQVFAVYIQQNCDSNRVIFPVKVAEMIWFDDLRDQNGLFDCTLLCRKLTDTFISADIIVRRNGRLWCVINGWQSMRLGFDNIMYRITQNPRDVMVADEIAPCVFRLGDRYRTMNLWNSLVPRYLNGAEFDRMNELPMNRRREYLISRIAVKDALRRWTLTRSDRTVWPIEFALSHDPNGRPLVSGVEAASGAYISIAHKGVEAVGAASDKPVGVDIEKIEPRTQAFMDIAFTPSEQQLLATRDNALWTTRFWVAKEAVAKMNGHGLQGNPKQFEVTEIISDDALKVGDCRVNMLTEKDFIVGWTV
ncbi:MAG: 4'-phosphopantetheinyl transferase superfamily protein [Bacteroidales bacterium]|jgi:phosphopantetheinyl transferase/malonyl CoA-acyl carrier protein transacylase|nr:4'-phosphopantetheinyl transferase superfamily protein [Bacteroidales bacterium]